MHRLTIALFAATMLAAATPAVADDLADKQYVLDLGLGAMAQPSYPGADAMTGMPYPLIAADRFFVPGLGEVIEEGYADRLSVYPSFNFIGRRDSSDSKALQGLDDVDWSFEAGLGLAYRHDWIRGFAELRQGFNGYSGQVAVFGAEVILTPSETLEVTAGPRAHWGSKGFMGTYFGVTAAEAASSPVIGTAYDADAGLYSVGLAASASYALTDRWTAHAEAGWDRLIGDAADSPIVKDGSADQFHAGVGLSYRFGFNLF